MFLRQKNDSQNYLRIILRAVNELIISNLIIIILLQSSFYNYVHIHVSSDLITRPKKVLIVTVALYQLKNQ
jgi:hypothetical protein